MSFSSIVQGQKRLLPLVAAGVGFLPFLPIFFRKAYLIQDISPLVVFLICCVLGAVGFLLSQRYNSKISAWDEKKVIKLCIGCFATSFVLFGIYLFVFYWRVVNSVLFPIVITGDLAQEMGTQSIADFSGNENKTTVIALLNDDGWVLVTRFLLVAIVAVSTFFSVISFSVASTRLIGGKENAIAEKDGDDHTANP